MTLCRHPTGVHRNFTALKLVDLAKALQAPKTRREVGESRVVPFGADKEASL